MKIKIKFETKTRCKERDSMRKTYEKYAEIYDKLVENKVYGTLYHYFHPEDYAFEVFSDLSMLYKNLEDNYYTASKYRYWIHDDIRKVYDYMKTAVLYHGLCYEALDGKRYNPYDALDYVEEHEKYLYQAIAVQEISLAKKHATCCPVIQCMLLEQYEKAKELLMLDTEETDIDEEVDFIHIPWVKNIYLAMLNGDENAFNEQLAKRINQYRRRPSEYQPHVDATSIAMIWFAKRLNLKYKFQVSEIPEYFLLEHHHEIPADCRLINLHNCEVAFQKWGKQTPTLEEIRSKLFIQAGELH